MEKVHLSEEQRALCVEFSLFLDRPKRSVYDNFQKRMDLLTGVKPKQKDIPNTLKGNDAKSIKLLPAFDALKDLPVGWAVESLHDSGNNHVIVSAGKSVLRILWNLWGYDTRTKSLLTPPEETLTTPWTHWSHDNGND